MRNRIGKLTVNLLSLNSPNIPSMKKLLGLLLFTGAIIYGTSCQKCLECQYSYTDSSGYHTIPVGQNCGAEDDLTALESQCETSAQSVQGTCECYKP